MSRTYATLYERLVANTVEPENERACWIHTGSLNKPNGYPQVTLKARGPSRKDYAHRLMFKCMCQDLFPHAFDERGEIRPEFEVDHTCYGNRCINPDHLRPLPVADNRALNRKPAEYATCCPT